MKSKSKTIFGYSNCSFFVPGQNPYGHHVWYATRAQRDAALDALIEDARESGLASPDSSFSRLTKVIRTESQWDWLDRLREYEGNILLANGIDGLGNAPSHGWGMVER